MISVRPAGSADTDAIWAILEPVIRAGETYTLARDLDRQHALAYWLSGDHTVFVAEEECQILGAYFLHPNQKGGGSDVANCGYVTSSSVAGRGVARTMCLHSLDYAKTLGFHAMQFNFVVSTNEAAVHLWQKLGFGIAGRLPEAFLHPRLGYVDALVMYRLL